MATPFPLGNFTHPRALASSFAFSVCLIPPMPFAKIIYRSWSPWCSLQDGTPILPGSHSPLASTLA